MEPSPFPTHVPEGAEEDWTLVDNTDAISVHSDSSSSSSSIDGVDDDDAVPDDGSIVDACQGGVDKASSAVTGIPPATTEATTTITTEPTTTTTTTPAPCDGIATSTSTGPTGLAASQDNTTPTTKPSAPQVISTQTVALEHTPLAHPHPHCPTTSAQGEGEGEEQGESITGQGTGQRRRRHTGETTSRYAKRKCNWSRSGRRGAAPYSPRSVTVAVAGAWESGRQRRGSRGRAGSGYSGHSGRARVRSISPPLYEPRRKYSYRMADTIPMYDPARKRAYRARRSYDDDNEADTIATPVGYDFPSYGQQVRQRYASAGDDISSPYSHEQAGHQCFALQPLDGEGRHRLSSAPSAHSPVLWSGQSQGRGPCQCTWSCSTGGDSSITTVSTCDSQSEYTARAGWLCELLHDDAADDDDQLWHPYGEDIECPARRSSRSSPHIITYLCFLFTPLATLLLFLVELMGGMELVKAIGWNMVVVFAGAFVAALLWNGHCAIEEYIGRGPTWA